MIRLSANLNFLFGELPFLDRFAAARAAGFAAVEFTFVYDMPIGAIAHQCRANRLTVVLLNAPAGNIAAGECGIAALPGREQELRDSVDQALFYASHLDARLVHLLAGNVPAGADPADLETRFVENLRWAADRAIDRGVTITIEPLNAIDRPDYLLRSSRQASRILRRVARPNVRLQLDRYHHQLTEGRPSRRFAALMPLIAHVQIAGVPGRREPDRGLLDADVELSRLSSAGYAGHVGCEYVPAAGTLAGLGWARRYLEAASVAA